MVSQMQHSIDENTPVEDIIRFIESKFVEYGINMTTFTECAFSGKEPHPLMYLYDVYISKQQEISQRTDERVEEFKKKHSATFEYEEGKEIIVLE